MRHKATFILGTGVVCAVGIGNLAWRYRVHELPELIEHGDFEGTDVLAAELFEAGHLGREVKVLTAMLVACLVWMILLSRAEAGRAVVSGTPPAAFGFGSYL